MVNIHESRIEKLKEIIEIQSMDGNWNYSPYMFGMANGMLFSLSVLTGENPVYLEKPNEWLEDRKCKELELGCVEDYEVVCDRKEEDYDWLSNMFEEEL